MQSVLSRVWTRVAVSISYDDNHYTTGNTFYIIYDEQGVSEKFISFRYLDHFSFKWSHFFYRDDTKFYS